MSPAVSSTEVLQSLVAVLQSSAGADGVHGADEARAALPNLAMKPCLPNKRPHAVMLPNKPARR